MRSFFKFFLIVFLISLCSCSVADSKYGKIPFVEIKNQKIFLRYSTRDDVEKILGNPQTQEYFKFGLEDFNWDDFTVCSYENDNLSFHYNNKKEIIRITVNSNYSNKIKIPLGSLTDITREKIKIEQQKSGNENSVVSEDFISYSIKDLELNDINCSYWFLETLKIKWYDIYYENQW